MSRFFLFTLIFSIALLLLFFPIFITVSGYLNIEEQKLTFSFNLYKRIRLKGGYITRYDKGFVLHLSKTKAVLFPYKKLKSQRKVFSVMKAVEFISLKGVFEGNLERILPFYFLDNALQIFKNFEPRLNSCKFSFWITENECFKVTTETIFFFTNYILLMDLFEFIWRKIKWQLKIKKSIT